MKSILNIPPTPGVYIIENIITKQSYIGSSVNMQKRCNAHRCLLNNKKHTNTKLQRSYLKYGSENFCFKVLENTSKDQVIIAERRLVDLHNPFFNIRLVIESNLGISLSESTRQKMSISRKGKPLSDAQLLAIQQLHKNRIGKPVTGKTKESLMLGPKTLIGIKQSDITKEKIRQSKIGKKFNRITRKYE